MENSHETWRLTEEQEALFIAEPRCWWFLNVLKDCHWDPEVVLRQHAVSVSEVEAWLVKLERRAIIRRTPGGRVQPDDAAGQSWLAGPAHGDAVIRPLQDELLAHVRERIRNKSDHPLPGATECGFGNLSLTPATVHEFKAALREVVSQFAQRARRERAALGQEALVPVGVLTVMAPYSLAEASG